MLIFSDRYITSLRIPFFDMWLLSKNTIKLKHLLFSRHFLTEGIKDLVFFK